MGSSEKNKRPAAFLDRDGVLIRDSGYVYRPEDLEILPGVFEGLQFLNESSYLLILVSNQSGVARGYFSCADVESFHRVLQEELQRQLGFGLDGIYYCPHHPEGHVTPYNVSCACRKPGIGMLEQAAKDFAIDWERSLMIGDRESDISCARKAGIQALQIVSDQYKQHATADHNLQSLADLRNLLSHP